jgi:hypothetical protein
MVCSINGLSVGDIKLIFILLQLSHLQKYEDMLAKLHTERAQRLINLVPTVSA